MSEKRGKILCVDDEPNIARALQWLLQKEFDVVTASSGQAALALLAEHDFDVLISDQRMPLMTGVEFFREARKISPRSIRILLTGYSDLQAVLRSVNEGEIYRFINKPWNISELPKVVGQAVVIARTQPVEAPEPVVTEETPIPAATEECVLLIDDDPRVREVVEEAIGGSVRLLHALNLAEAIGLLNEQRVAVVVSETSVGSIDATRLISVLKDKHPEIISIIMSGQPDVEMVTGLINEGQIYRFVPKPVRIGYLKLAINSALVKHRHLRDTPGLAQRYSVDPMVDSRLVSLLEDLERLLTEQGQANGSAAPPSGDASLAPASQGLLGRVNAGLKRLLR